ncbi:MAG: hypothetical protein ABW221_01560 [Vicinamibacteria bacterium]
MRLPAAPVVLAGALAAGCAPVFSDLQSARMLPPGAVEVTPAVGTTWVSDAGDDGGRVQDQLGAQTGYGLTRSVELRARYERVRVGDEGGANVAALGAKVALVRDRLAVYVPVAIAFDSSAGSPAFAAQPALIATFDAGAFVELNPSVKYTVPINDADGFRGLALGLGLGFGPRDAAWKVRPEAGVFFGRNDTTWYQATLGVSLRPR